jgi:pimeloyl-ACP methyl ester carboxylesterase
MDMIGQSHETRVGESTIAWSELGHGPALVLLHGVQDSHRSWRRVAPLLAGGYRVIMPDLAGHGLSGRPDATYTLEWHAWMVGTWMEAIGLPRAHFCGHSFGGGIAQYLLLEDRRRIDRLALVSPGGLGREVGLGLKLATLPVLGPWFTPLVVSLGFRAFLWLAPKTFGSPEPDEVRMFRKMGRIPGSTRAFLRTVRGVINLRGQYLQTIQRAHEIVDLPPIALFWGSLDPVLPIQHGRLAQARASGVTLTTYPGVGHFPQLEVPERFAQDLLAFLADRDRPGARDFPGPRVLPSRDHAQGSAAP